MLTDLLVELASLSVAVFGMVLLAVQFLAFEGGRWLGRKRPVGDDSAEGSSMVIGSMLGLIGFVLALTLAHASARFEERRQGTIGEANAIGTAWLRSSAIGHDKGNEISLQLRDYAKTRLAFVRANAESADLRELNRRTGQLQSAIWQNFTVIAQERKDPLVAELMKALNDMFDRSTGERFAFALPIPPQIFWLVLVLPLTALAALGFHLGQRRDRQLILPIILMAMLTSVVTLVLDLASPRLGSIRPSNLAYEWTISGQIEPPSVNQRVPAP